VGVPETVGTTHAMRKSETNNRGIVDPLATAGEMRTSACIGVERALAAWKGRLQNWELTRTDEW
jgi:hypothetical protein